MPFHKKTTLLCTIMAAVVLSPLAVSSVENIKTTGSAKGYDLIEDNISSSRNDPGFVTNSLGSDNYSPRISLDGSRGRPAAIDLTNGTGSPAINLSRTSGYNSSISSSINDVVKNGSNQTGVWTTWGSNISILSAGQYSTILAPNAIGQSCVKGSLGLVMTITNVCTMWNSHGKCIRYTGNGMSTETGKRAVCN